MTDPLYRPGVGVMLLNGQRQVWVGQRLDSTLEAWQMPQGGLDDGEDALEGAQIFVGGTQQAHDEVGRNIHAAANGRVRVSVRLAGRHLGFSASFWVLAWSIALEHPVYRRVLTLPNASLAGWLITISR